MVMLKREKVALDRDVIFLAVSDEEADGTGTDWFIAHQKDLLGNAEFLINEGGENLLEGWQGEVCRRRRGREVSRSGCTWWRMAGRGMGRGPIRIPRRTGWCGRLNRIHCVPHAVQGAAGGG